MGGKEIKVKVTKREGGSYGKPPTYSWSIGDLFGAGASSEEEAVQDAIRAAENKGSGWLDDLFG